MKTDVITVNGNQVESVLRLVDKTAAYKGLARRDALHLSLLAEEALGMMRAVTGEKKAEFWLEDQSGVYEMHLRMHTRMDEEKKKRLISASSDGRNQATRTLMGKIRAFFEPDGEAPLTMRCDVLYDAPPDTRECLFWSMADYREELYLRRDISPEETARDWDELEKSVVAHVADDVRVFIRGSTAEMTIFKRIA